MLKSIEKLEEENAPFEKYVELIINSGENSLLSQLSESKNLLVRGAVALNPNTDRDVLEILFRDKELFVRCLAHHPLRTHRFVDIMN
jgi:hypothetical protein